MTPPSNRTERRLAALEARLARLESTAVAATSDATRQRSDAPPATTARRSGTAEPPASTDDRFWALERVLRDAPSAGAVLYTGVARLPGGELRWQMGRGVDDLLGQDWGDLAGTLAALGHPMRLQVLRAVLGGTSSTQGLQALPEMATTGQLYHHLKELESAGWLRSLRRGEYGVPAERVIPLLAILSAAIQ